VYVFVVNERHACIQCNFVCMVVIYANNVISAWNLQSLVQNTDQSFVAKKANYQK